MNDPQLDRHRQARADAARADVLARIAAAAAEARTRRTAPPARGADAHA